MCTRAVSLLVGPSSRVSVFRSGRAWGELEADHISHSSEKVYYKRVKGKSLVSHRKNGNEKNSYLLEKTQYPCLLVE